MNAYPYTKADRHNRGLLARPSPRYANPVAGRGHHQRTLLNQNHYVISEASEALPLHEQDHYTQQLYDASYSHAYNDRFPIDEGREELKPHRHRAHRLSQTRMPGYVTSFDNTPSQPLPHSSLTSNNVHDAPQMMYDNNNYNNYADAMAGHSPHMPGQYDELYGAGGWSAGGWSSDTSSDASQGHGRHARHRHRTYPGQRRMTDLGQEVFNGMAWVSEEDYMHDSGLMTQSAGYISPYERTY